MPILTVSVAFDTARDAWVVCRAHTAIAHFKSRDQAIAGATETAFALRRRMHCDMRIRIHDAGRGWHDYLSMNDRRSAAAMALRVLEKFRLPPPDRTAERVRELRPWPHAGDKTGV